MGYENVQLLVSASHLPHHCGFFGSGTSAKIWDCSSTGVWVFANQRVDILFTSLALFNAPHRGGRRFTDLRPYIK